jgi:hypothetical protein
MYEFQGMGYLNENASMTGGFFEREGVCRSEAMSSQEGSNPNSNNRNTNTKTSSSNTTTAGTSPSRLGAANAGGLTEFMPFSMPTEIAENLQNILENQRLEVV